MTNADQVTTAANGLGWERHKDGSVRHIWPLADLAEHRLDDDKICWCKPRVEDIYGHTAVIHHAADQRELVETGERMIQ